MDTSFVARGGRGLYRLIYVRFGKSALPDNVICAEYPIKEHVCGLCDLFLRIDVIFTTKQTYLYEFVDQKKTVTLKLHLQYAEPLTLAIPAHLLSWCYHDHVDRRYH
jgi:hypothetical protein